MGSYRRKKTLQDGTIREVVVHENDGLRKLCDCSRRTWAKCSHPWHFNYKPRGGQAHRFSLDAEIGRRVKDKTEAEKLANSLREQINAGTFVRAAERRRQAAATPAVDDAVTLDTFKTRYIDRHASVSGKTTWKNDEHMLAQLCAYEFDGVRLGAKLLRTVTEDDLEAFHAALRAKGRAASTLNQYVQVLKASFRWAAKKGYLARSPITEDSALTRRKIAQRDRRLVPDVLDDKGKLKTPGEERRLLAATEKNPGMQRLIIAALDTACRRGELLALTWSDIDLNRREFTIRAANAKDGETRVLPISSRLAGVLAMAKLDPAGQEYKLTDHVFGELGHRVKSTKKAWNNACERAGISDLHFHDLRHEAGSRLLEAGWPIHHVKEMLGHANLSQTSTYLNAGKMGLQNSMRRFDNGNGDSVRANDSGGPGGSGPGQPETQRALVN